MSGAGDFYTELGIDKSASSEEIKKAFRKLARTCHPDVARDDPAAAEKFARIREAYETLVDPARRARYDRRGQRRKVTRGAEWRPPGGWGGFSARGRSRGGGRGNRQPEMDLEDIFTAKAGAADFGFGASRGGRQAGGASPSVLRQQPWYRHRRHSAPNAAPDDSSGYRSLRSRSLFSCNSGSRSRPVDPSVASGS